MKTNAQAFERRVQLFTQLDTEFSVWRPTFQEIAELLLPRRYVYLSSTIGNLTSGTSSLVNNAAQNLGLQRNSKILDPTGTVAARTLAHGMMNGVTSPARPWFRLRLTGYEEEGSYPHEWLIWLEETTRRMHLVMADSNFYNSLAILYLELVGFGTAACIIYDDFQDIIRCYNSPMGEFRLIQDNRRMVSGMSRAFNMKVHQVVKEFGEANVSAQTLNLYKAGGAHLMNDVTIAHMIEENSPGPDFIRGGFAFREVYWEHGRQTGGEVLRLAGFSDKPFMCPRWEVTGNDTYGHCPTMDALPEIKQLQLETKIKAQALDKMVRPPIVADMALQAQATALLPGGVSYVPSSSSFGAKPIFTVNPPLAEMTNDIMRLQERIKTIYYNNLFRNISELQTVRSAAEIYERKAEDMVLLGSVLERFENEALDPAIRRIYSIMRRRGLLPEMPAGLAEEALDVQYVSILSDAQRAANSGAIERAMQVIAQLGSVYPEALTIPDFEEMIRDYFLRINVPAKHVKSRERVAEEREAQQEQLALQQEALVGEQLTSATKNLAQSDLGGGQNALSALLGG